MQAPTPNPSVSKVKSSFARSIAQITRSNPDNAFSVMPAILDVILDSIPKAVEAVAVTSIDEEALEMSASEQPFAANRKGMLPLMDLVMSVPPCDILNVMRFLHGHAQLQFKQLVEMTAVDYPERTNARFEVTYVLWSPTLNARLIVKTMVSELEPLESVTPVYPNADWLERETWDMFGVFFKNHPNLRRLLTDYGFMHHPLRKDFPVQGYTEVFYSESRKAVTTRSIQLAQTQRVVAGQN
jgi:NADH/F420H2 dehydrogenase subunit C